MASKYKLNNYDYIIIGQGIAGTFLSYYLYKAGKKILVFDKSKSYTASKVATGIINPVTGRRIVATWMIETILPFAVKAYQELEIFLNISIISQKNILDFHPTPQMQQAFDERIKQDTTYLKKVENINTWKNYFNFPFSAGETNPCYLINLHLLLKTWRNYLQQKEMLIEEYFEPAEAYKTTTKIIFADGIESTTSPFFSNLPFSKNKGEALIIETELPTTNIYKNSIILVPWHQPNSWWVGSSYEWNYINSDPSEKFRTEKEDLLKRFLKSPFKVIEHISSLRPANIERRPFVGLHPLYKNIGIFNGMGTKGCSLSPFFANQFTQHLINGKTLLPEIDVKRFEKILSKKYEQ